MFGNRTAERGFTLLETMIAGGMLIVGVVGLMGMQITAINANRFGNRMAQSLMFSEEMAARIVGNTWDTLAGYQTAVDVSQPDGFRVIDPTIADPSGFNLALPADGLTSDGAVVAFNAGNAIYQRIVQVVGEDINPQISGIDAMRIKVTVRFRDSQATTKWRSASIIVLRPKVM